MGRVRRINAKNLVFFILLVTPSVVTGSHIMTSDSREEPEFQMVYNGIEGHDKEKVKVVKDAVAAEGGTPLPPGDPIHPPPPPHEPHHQPHPPATSSAQHDVDHLVLDEVSGYLHTFCFVQRKYLACKL